jgi:16S rRNA (uracil1498-N3)-methyltransferase
VNTLLLTPEEAAGARDGRVRLADDRRVAHVRTVHRAAVGDVLQAGALGGLLGTARVLALDDDGLEIEIAFHREPPPPLPLVLVLALPRPKVVRRVLQAVTTLGVKRLALIAAWRVEKSYWESPLLTDAAVDKELVLGLEQAGDSILPTVTLHRLFKPFVEDELPALAAGSRGLVAHPNAAHECPRALREPVTLAIGPDGGFTEYEIGKLGERGFEAVSLGPRLLRVEQAVSALVGRLF